LSDSATSRDEAPFDDPLPDDLRIQGREGALISQFPFVPAQTEHEEGEVPFERPSTPVHLINPNLPRVAFPLLVLENSRESALDFFLTYVPSEP
jgi:hypothetical protein